MNSIEDTAQQFKVVAPIKEKLRAAMYSTQRVYQIFSYFKNSNSNMPSTENNVGDEIVKFTGQHTDIAFCGITNGISIDDINNIQDDITRENTMLNFNEAVKDGYLNYDEVNGFTNF